MEKIYRIKELVKQLNHASDVYHNSGKTVMSDLEFDTLLEELRNLEQETGFIMSASPTHTVGYEVKSELQKVAHNHPMLSLAKTKDWNEFIRYFKGKDVVGMVKMDGLTCSLRYVNGTLVSAETRGNGEIGEDVLHNIRTVKTVPKNISYKDELIIDGEIVCTYEDFKPFSDEYKNPRNFASGSIRLLDSNECAKRPLTFVVWNVIKGFDEANSFLVKLDLIEKQGFVTVPWTSSFDFDAKEFLVGEAKELGYPIDGLVGRFDDIKYGESLGATSHHSNAAYAYKFYDEVYETTLRDIEWTMGKTGALTPTAVFDSVEIDGTEVSRASLHNISIIKSLGLTNNCTIKIFKANQIIPQIDSAEQDGDSPIEIPKYCPICGGETRVVKDNESEVLVCTNPNCSGKLLGKLTHFVSKKAMDIDGLSENTLRLLIEAGFIGNTQSFCDIYHLKFQKDKLVLLNGMGQKSVENLLQSIEKSRNVKLENFICALSIPNIGLSASKTISNYFNGDYNIWIQAYRDCFEWTCLNDFGVIMAASLEKYLEENFDMVQALATEMNFIVEEKKSIINDFISGKTFCVTGAFNTMKRSEIEKIITERGGKLSGSVSKKTDYLLTNEANSGSSKAKKAAELGTPIMSEEEFLSML